ncbi:BLUF domain-containing protein (plasmid) [Sphingosinicella sp. BN140058]|nr:BLUF domain-containing protein [Sphingosinicella sp. BN140058]
MTLEPEEVAGGIAAIVEVARSRNADLGISGALVATDAHFAQILEGRRDAVFDVMASIERDRRHTEVTVVWTEDREQAFFSDWSMAYAGTAEYVDKKISPLLRGSLPEHERQGVISELLLLIQCFVREEE